MVNVGWAFQHSIHPAITSPGLLPVSTRPIRRQCLTSLAIGWDSDDKETTTGIVSDDSRTSRRLFLATGLLSASGVISAVAQLEKAHAAVPSLPWVKDPLNPKRSTLRVQDAEALGYNLAFVTYLTRFLLNFDPLAQQWWIDSAKEIPSKATSQQIFAIRQDQFSKFAASVGLGLLQEFDGPQGPTRLLQSLLDRFCSMEVTETDSSKKNRLIRQTKEARRQLALLFGLLTGDFQPTTEITKLLASVDNGSVSSVELFNDPALLRGYAPGDTPNIQLPLPQAGEGYVPARAKAVLTPTGELLRLDILEKEGVFQRVPTVLISPPKNGGRPAQAIAKVKKGELLAIQLTDPGQGYTMDDIIDVKLEPVEAMLEQPIVKVQAVLEMEISAIEVEEPGSGYAVEKPIRVTLVPPSGRKPEVVGLGYFKGERGSFKVYRLSDDNKLRTFEQALDERSGGVVSGTTSGGSLPPLPFTSKASSSQQLLSLLPQGFGLEYDKEKKRYFLTVDQEMVGQTYSTPKSSARLVPDFGPRGESPIERDMQLDLPTFLRFCLSGAICSSGVHLALTPLDVVKTKVQTNPTKYPKILPAFSTIWKEEGVGTFFTGWLPTVSGNFIGGAVLYATTELIRRSLTEYAGASAPSLEVVIILASAGIASSAAATVFCPFEAVRIRGVAQPEFGSNSLDVLQRMIKEEGIGSLVNAIPVFLVKAVPYACVKFTVFDLSTEYLYKSYPAAEEDLKLSLLISLVGGVMAGVAAAVVSNPADAVIAELKKSKSDQTPQEAVKVLLERAGVAALFKGLQLRMVFYSLTSSFQFLIFDGIRFALGIGPDDLRLYLDVLGGALTERGTIA